MSKNKILAIPFVASIAMSGIILTPGYAQEVEAPSQEPAQESIRIIEETKELATSFESFMNSVTVYVTVDGEGKGSRVQRGKVKAALEELGVKLNPLDRVSADLESEVQDKQFIQITRVAVKERKVEYNDVAFKKVAGDTPVECKTFTDAGTVSQKGVNGTRTETFTETYYDEVLITTVKSKDEVTTKAVDEVTSKCLPESISTPSLSSSPSQGTKVTGTKQEWMKAAGIAESDWTYVDYIVFKESTWNYKAVNSSSGATGLCQSLPASKMATAGPDYLTNPVTQLKWCDSYAKSRYGGWANSYNVWLSKKWW